MTESNARKADLTALRIDRSETKPRSKRARRLVYLFWLILPIVGYFGYQYTLKQVTPSTKVKVERPRYLIGGDAAAELVATGYVVAQIKAAVSSKATGRLESLNVEEGDKVVAGQVLAELDNDDIVANLDLYRAYLKQYKADSQVAALNYSRQKRLYELGHTTDEVLEQATAEYERALANVEAGYAQVKAAQVAVENTIIRAPFDGTVLTKDADVGEMVAPMAASVSSRGAVVTVADMSSLEVEADVSESNINKVKLEQRCEIILDAYPRIHYGGFVKKIVPTADRSRATVMVKVAFDDKDDRVLPEMSARVNFMQDQGHETTIRAESTLVVNSDAVVRRDGRSVVFVIENGYARRVAAVFGRKLGTYTEILSGLSTTSQVILSPPGGLADGDKVNAGL